MLYFSRGGYMSIDNLSPDQALEAIRVIASKAIAECDLSIVLGSNGMSGRNATGNYSLLAKATGLSRVHIGKVLKGKVEPSLRTLNKLANVTGLSLDDINEFIQMRSREVA